MYDLRHSHASLLVKIRTQPKKYSSIRSINIEIAMNLYSYLYEKIVQEVVNMFDKLIKAN